MSSGTRNEKLERVLAAKYELECCDDEEKATYLLNYERLLDEVLQGSNVSRFGLTEAIREAYIEYKKARAKSQRRRDTL
jgi:hypothetical protein